MWWRRVIIGGVGLTLYTAGVLMTALSGSPALMVEGLVVMLTGATLFSMLFA